MNNIRKFGVAVSAAMTALTVWAGAAYATTSPLDSVTTEVNAAKTEFSTFVTGTGVPVLFALLILGVGISLAVKYVRRGARSA